MKVHNPNNLPTTPIADLLPTQGDLKDLTEKNYNKLKNVILNRGFSYPVYVWEDKHGLLHLLDGHQRQRVLTTEGWNEPVPYLKVPAKDLQEAMARLLEITSQYATITQEGIDEFIAKYELPEAEIYEATHYDALMFGQDAEPEPEVEEDEAPEVDESEPPKSKLGEVYQLGRHRVMCGDSTVKDNVGLLMNGAKADMVFTDPPYGIGKTDIKNDDFESYLALMDSMFQLTEQTTKNQLWMFGMFPEYIEQFYIGKKYGYSPYQQLIFIKPVSRETNNKITDKAEYLVQYAKEQPPYYEHLVDFHLQADFLSDRSVELYESAVEFPEKWRKRFPNRDKKTQDREIKGLKRMVNLFKLKTNLGFNNHGKDLPGEAGLGLHPTQKPPLELGHIIQTFSKKKHIIIDPFLGSGSTLIACEQTDRTCYGMELDPKYCDVIRKRYWKYINDGNEEGWEDGTVPTV